MPSRKKIRIGPKKKYSSLPPRSARPAPRLREKFNDTADSDKFFAKPLDFFVPNESSLSYQPKEYVDSDGFKANEFLVILDKAYRYCPDVNLDEFVALCKCLIFSGLRENCKQKIKNLENFMYMSKASDLKYVELYDSNEHWEAPRVKMCVSVNRNLVLTVTVHGKSLPENHSIYKLVGRDCYTVKSVQNVLHVIKKYNICIGNQDTELQDLMPVGTNLDASECSNYKAYRESFFIGSTIRSTECDFIIKLRGNRCLNCQRYRKTLRKKLYRQQNTPQIPTHQKDWTKCNTSNNKLTENQKVHKIRQLKEYSHQLELENARLSSEIKRKIRSDGVLLTEREHKDWPVIVESYESDIKQSHLPDSSYQILFWEQQLK